MSRVRDLPKGIGGAFVCYLAPESRYGEVRRATDYLLDELDLDLEDALEEDLAEWWER